MKSLNNVFYLIFKLRRNNVLQMQMNLCIRNEVIPLPEKHLSASRVRSANLRSYWSRTGKGPQSFPSFHRNAVGHCCCHETES